VIKDVDDLLASLGGEIDGKADGAELITDAFDQQLQIGIVDINLVDDDDPGDSAVGRDVHEPAGAALDAAQGVNDDGDRFHRGIAATACPTKSAKPGVSIRLIRRPWKLKWKSLAVRECLWCRSASEKSLTVVPSSTVPIFLRWRPESESGWR